MTVSELQEAKRLQCPVILKANPPRTYDDAEYKCVKDIVIRKIAGKLSPAAVLEDYSGHSLVYAEISCIVKKE